MRRYQPGFIAGILTSAFSLVFTFLAYVLYTLFYPHWRNGSACPLMASYGAGTQAGAPAGKHTSLTWLKKRLPVDIFHCLRWLSFIAND